MALKNKTKTPEVNIVELLTIDPSDLELDLVETLKNFGYYGALAAREWVKVRGHRQTREEVAGQFYMISKDDVLDNGRPPSDKYIEMELTQDEDWVDAQTAYSKSKGVAEEYQILVRGLEFKLESLRTLLANERTDKQLHLKD